MWMRPRDTVNGTASRKKGINEMMSLGEKMCVHKCSYPLAARKVKTRRRYTQSTSKGIISCYIDKSKP